MSIPYTNVLTALVALAAVIGLVVLVGRLARSTGLARARPGRRLIVGEAMPLDRNRTLRIVSCDGREMLLLVGGGADVCLGWLPGPDLPR